MVPLDRLFSTHIYARKEKPFLHLLNEFETPYGILSVASVYGILSLLGCTDCDRFCETRLGDASRSAY